jgi:hypothetical protein
MNINLAAQRVHEKSSTEKLKMISLRMCSKVREEEESGFRDEKFISQSLV